MEEKEKIVKRRRKPQQGKSKRVTTVSFSGDEGYEALDFASATDHTLGRSGLIIDLLLAYKHFKKNSEYKDLSDDEAIEKLKELINLNIDNKLL